MACNEYYIGEICSHKQQINHAEYRQIKLSEHLDIPVCSKKLFSVFPVNKSISHLIRKEK